MKREITYVRVKPLSAFRMLFWNPCQNCWNEFKGEPMWVVMINPKHPIGSKPKRRLFCLECAPTTADAVEMYENWLPPSEKYTPPPEKIDSDRGGTPPPPVGLTVGDIVEMAVDLFRNNTTEKMLSKGELVRYDGASGNADYPLSVSSLHKTAYKVAVRRTEILIVEQHPQEDQ